MFIQTGVTRMCFIFLFVLANDKRICYINIKSINGIKNGTNSIINYEDWVGIKRFSEYIINWNCFGFIFIFLRDHVMQSQKFVKNAIVSRSWSALGVIKSAMRRLKITNCLFFKMTHQINILLIAKKNVICDLWVNCTIE